MITQQTLEFFFKLLKNESGLVLDASKKYLLETRLEPIVAQEGFSSIEDLGVHLMEKRDPILREKVVDATTTNETSFFRDKHPFETLKEVILPALIKTNKRTRQLRIWCAASSTGQEPYSIAMFLSDMAMQFRGWDIQILATDISDRVLKKAEEGMYSQHEIQRGLPTPYLLRYFDKLGMRWKIKDAVKRMVTFKKLNLLSNFSSIGLVDIIFCRNILIYLDRKTKHNVVKRMTQLLSAEGVLFLGSTEMLLDFGDRLICVGSRRSRYFQKNGKTVV
ncbi:MAG: CheR family methyltransferase [Nitrospiria bacterium]